MTNIARLVFWIVMKIQNRKIRREHDAIKAYENRMSGLSRSVVGTGVTLRDVQEQFSRFHDRRVGACGHAPDQIAAKMDAHDAAIREHARQEEAVLSFVEEYADDPALVRDLGAIIERARRAEWR